MKSQTLSITDKVRELLREEREQLGLTARQHALQLGISEPTYFRIQNGQINKTTAVLLGIALRSSRLAEVPAAA